MTDASNDRLLKDREGAAIFGVCRSQFWALVKKGKLPEPVRFCGATRWSERELQAKLSELLASRNAAPEARTFPATSPRTGESAGRDHPDRSVSVRKTAPGCEGSS